MLGFWTPSLSIPFGAIANNNSYVFVLDTVNKRIVRISLSDYSLSTLDFSSTLQLDQWSRINCTSNSLIISASDAIYQVSATTGIVTLEADMNDIAGSCDTFASRQLPVSSGLSSYIFAKQSGGQVGDDFFLRKYDMSDGATTYTNLESNTPALNSYTDISSVCSIVDILMVVRNNGGSKPNIWHVHIDSNPPFPAYNNYLGLVDDIGDVLAGTKHFDTSQIVSFNVFFHKSLTSSTSIMIRNTNGGKYSVSLGFNVNDAFFSAEVDPSSATPCYVLKNEGNGRGRLGRITGTSFTWLTS